MQKFHFLDQLIFGYFNQDYDIINNGEDTIEGIVGLFKQSAPDWMLKDLVEEVDDFLSAYGDEVESEFKRRYDFDFSPELWDTTAYEFLMTVRKIASAP
ncbi:contact-dependent growth inhibition system immunity protein [Pantoea sp. BAV 3049]|uniref:contact-dependent growth inhibition system immunity protein n=1 Tax=Pantoea sp. BAV 3049 TaxID=2654188 RepID=UPI00131AFC29|nr:contact-dependent growth inhibition system immunity protein [Pantoea sp. BAV 3049]